jgi:hypothetical protein
MAFAEWSAPDDADPTDREAQAQANPAANIRISFDYIDAEQKALPAAEFSMERLSIWPDVAALGTLIPIAEWSAGGKPDAVMPKGVPISVGVAISPKRDWASVGVAGFTPDGGIYVEVIKHEAGVDWLLPYLVGLVERRAPMSLVVDQVGPAGTLLAAMGAAGLDVRTTDTGAYKAACGAFVDAVKYGKIRHREQQALTDAANGVKERKVGDSYVYARRDSGVLISPLEAVTLAVWGLTPEQRKKEFFMIDLNDIDLTE